MSTTYFSLMNVSTALPSNLLTPKLQNYDLAELQAPFSRVCDALGFTDEPTIFETQIARSHNDAEGMTLFLPPRLWNEGGSVFDLRFAAKAKVPPKIRADARQLIDDSRFVQVGVGLQTRNGSISGKKILSRASLAEKKAEQLSDKMGYRKIKPEDMSPSELYLQAGLLYSMLSGRDSILSAMNSFTRSADGEGKYGEYLRAAMVMEIGYQKLFPNVMKYLATDVELRGLFCEYSSAAQDMWMKAMRDIRISEEVSFAVKRSFSHAIFSISTRNLFSAWELYSEKKHVCGDDVKNYLRGFELNPMVKMIDVNIAASETENEKVDTIFSAAQFCLEFAEAVYDGEEYAFQRLFLLGQALYYADRIKDLRLVSEVHERIASVLSTSGEHEVAILHYLKAMKILTNEKKMHFGDKATLADAVEGLSTSYSMTSNANNVVQADIDLMNSMLKGVVK